MRYVLLICLLLLPLMAEQLSPGQIYEGPRKLTAPNLGASFMLPRGFRAQLATAAGPLVVQSDAGESRILMEANVSVTGHPSLLLPKKRDYYGLRLFSATQIKRLRASLYYRLYRVDHSDTFTSVLVYVVLGPQGRGVLMYGFFREGGYDAMRQRLLRLSDSLAYTPIRVLPSQTDSLYLKLADGHFVFYERRGSFSEKREVWLCRDGSARLRGSYAIANQTSRTSHSRQGAWRLQGTRLELTFSDDTFERYRVTMEHATLYFDQAQTFRLPNHACP